MAFRTLYRRAPRGLLHALTVFVVLLAGAGIGAGAFALAHGGDTTRVHGCVNTGSGALRVIDASGQCRNNEQALDWSIEGPAGPQGERGESGDQGPSGDFTGVFTSDNGLYSLSVTDDGIVLTSPTGSLRMTDFNTTLTDRTVRIEGEATTRVNGGVVILNCGPTDGGFPVARVNDQVLISSPVSGAIMSGSQTVTAC
ncbi:MAG TPA: hypothetical protein VMM78_03215 [Thermomicrobiales bacterium]|nr:hypothetical protein [Thermomicrobiales bacterium]